MRFKIVSITDKDGAPRSNGRYPQRINSTVKIFEEHVTVGCPLMWHYITDGQGKPKEGHLTTSTIESVDRPDGMLIITTRNSAYTGYENCRRAFARQGKEGAHEQHRENRGD